MVAEPGDLHPDHGGRLQDGGAGVHQHLNTIKNQDHDKRIKTLDSTFFPSIKHSSLLGGPAIPLAALTRGVLVMVGSFNIVTPLCFSEKEGKFYSMEASFKV